MTEVSIKQKALTVANAFLGTDHATLALLSHQELYFALVYVVEQSETFKQEVGFALSKEWGNLHYGAQRNLDRFRIPLPKPDPLVEVVKGVTWYDNEITAKELRAALDARGLEIREKNDD